MRDEMWLGAASMVSLFFYGVDVVLRIGPGGQPFLQLVQRLAAVADLVLLRLVHLRIRRAFILEARVPA